MPGDRFGLRASDAERAAVTDALRTHCAEGRLEVEELEHRLARALGSRTVAELDALLNDLPALTSSAEALPARSSRLADLLPGVRHFYVRHALSAPRADVLPRLVRTLRRR